MKETLTPEEKSAVRERLERIAARNAGRLTPDDVVADAKRKDSPLHRYFEWDVRKAAARHWIDQARELIVSVHYVYRTETTQVRAVAYVRDPRCGPNEQGYVAVETVRSDADLARDVLIEEFGRVASMLRRARELATALNEREAVDKLLEGVVGLRDRVALSQQAQARQ